MTLLETFVEIKAKDDALKAGLKNARRYARGEVREMQKVFNSLKIGLPDVRSILAGAAAFYGAKRAVESLIGSTVTAGSTFVDMSARTGMAVETLSGLGYIAGQVGAEMGDVEKSVKFLTNTMLDVSRGTGASKKTFDALGIAVTDASGSLRPMTDVMMDAADKLAGMKNETLLTAYAMDLFGARTGAKMIPVLKLGSAGIREMMNEAKRLGIVMSTDDANAADTLGDSLATLGAALEGAKSTIAISIIPKLTEWVTATTELIAKNREMIGEKIGDWLEKIGGALETVWEHRDTIKTVFEISLMAAIATKLYAMGNAVIFLTAALAGLATSGGMAALIAAARPLMIIAGITAALYGANKLRQIPAPTREPLSPGLEALGAAENRYKHPFSNISGISPPDIGGGGAPFRGKSEYFPNPFDKLTEFPAGGPKLMPAPTGGGGGGGGGGNGERDKDWYLSDPLYKAEMSRQFRQSVTDMLAAEVPEDLTESARETVAEMDKIQKDHASNVIALQRQVRDTSIALTDDRWSRERLAETARYEDEISAYTGKSDLLELAAQDHWMRMTAIAKDQSAAAAAESLQFATTWGDALYNMFEQSEWTFGKIGQAFAKMIQGMLARAAVIGTLNFLSGGAGGFIGAFSGALRGRAEGGPVSAGTPYRVGERGVETFVPKMAGTIIPHGADVKTFVPKMAGKIIPNTTNDNSNVYISITGKDARTMDAMRLGELYREAKRRGYLKDGTNG